MRPDAPEDLPGDLPGEARPERPAGLGFPAHDHGIGARILLAGKTVVVGIFACMGLVAVVDMALTVAAPERPMQVAHLVFERLLHLGGLIIGVF